MIIIRAIAFILHFTLIPFVVGRLITYKKHTGFLADYLVGFFANLGIFYILYSIIVWIQDWITIVYPVYGGFTMLLRAYFIVIALICIAELILEARRIPEIFQYIKSKAAYISSEIKGDRYVAIYAVMFILLIGLQGYMAYGYEINEWSYDDYDYVVLSEDTISTDTLSYVNFIDGSLPNTSEKRTVTSWMTYMAMLTKMSGFEVTTVCHTIAPVFLILLAYMAHYYIAKFLLKKLDDRLIFMIVLSVAYIFGLYSHYSSTFRLLGALWQGKAVLSIIAVPFFMIYLVKAYEADLDNGYLLPVAAVSLGTCSLTSMAMMLIPMVAIFTWIVMSVYHKRIYGIRYLIASLFGPAYLGAFYILFWMLQQDMKSYDFKYFKFRQRNDWWYQWFY